MKKQLLALLFSASALAAVPDKAAADMYAGIWLGQSTIDFDAEGVIEDTFGINPSNYDTSEDDSDSFLSVGMGFQFSQNAAVEVAYNDFGEYAYTIRGGGSSVKATAEANSISVAAVGNYPLANSFGVIGKIGLEMWDAKGKLKGDCGAFCGSDDEDGTDIFFAFGASYDMTEAATARLEYQLHSFDLGDTDVDIDIFTVGFIFGF